MVGSQRDGVGLLTLQPPFPFFRGSLFLSLSPAPSQWHSRGDAASGDERRGSCLTTQTTTTTIVGGAQTPPLSFCFGKCPTPHTLLSHVVFVVTAPSFNEVRLLANHRVIGWASAGGVVYLQLTVCTAPP